jgi:hypothetical protein
MLLVWGTDMSMYFFLGLMIVFFAADCLICGRKCCKDDGCCSAK